MSTLLRGGGGQAGAEVGDTGISAQGLQHRVQGAQPVVRSRGGDGGDRVDGLVADADYGIAVPG